MQNDDDLKALWSSIEVESVSANDIAKKAKQQKLKNWGLLAFDMTGNLIVAFTIYYAISKEASWLLQLWLWLALGLGIWLTKTYHNRRLQLVNMLTAQTSNFSAFLKEEANYHKYIGRSFIAINNWVTGSIALLFVVEYFFFDNGFLKDTNSVIFTVFWIGFWWTLMRLFGRFKIRKGENIERKLEGLEE